MAGKRWVLVSKEADTLDTSLSDRNWYFHSIITARVNYNPPVLSLVQYHLARVAGTSEKTAADALKSLEEEGRLQATTPEYRPDIEKYTPRLLTDLTPFDLKLGQKFVAITEEVRDAYPARGRDRCLRIHAYLMHIALRNGECPPNPYKLTWIRPSLVSDVLNIPLWKVDRTYEKMREMKWLPKEREKQEAPSRLRLPDDTRPYLLNDTPGRRMRAYEVLALLKNDEPEWRRLVALAKVGRRLDIDIFLDEARKSLKKTPNNGKPVLKEWAVKYIQPPKELLPEILAPEQS